MVLVFNLGEEWELTADGWGGVYSCCPAQLLQLLLVHYEVKEPQKLDLCLSTRWTFRLMFRASAPGGLVVPPSIRATPTDAIQQISLRLPQL